MTCEKVAAICIDATNIDDECFEPDDDYDFPSLTFNVVVQTKFKFTLDCVKHEHKSFLHKIEFDFSFHSRLHIYDYSCKTNPWEIRV
jgi:hypothetical protein